MFLPCGAKRTRIMRRITSKEDLFCRYYAETFNARESAIRAGFSVFPEKTAFKLLKRAEIRDRIREVCGISSELNGSSAEAGLRRIAFGSAADCLRLIFQSDEENLKQLDSLDLFLISEIKKPRDGCIEIKLFDRLKALEKLLQLNENSESGLAQPFYRALEESAAKLDAGRKTT